MDAMCDPQPRVGVQRLVVDVGCVLRWEDGDDRLLALGHVQLQRLPVLLDEHDAGRLTRAVERRLEVGAIRVADRRVDVRAELEEVRQKLDVRVLKELVVLGGGNGRVVALHACRHSVGSDSR